MPNTEPRLTKAALKKFIAKRNRSRYGSNMQFQIDANACGFEVSDLGECKRADHGGYEWETPHGLLIEDQSYKLSLVEVQQ